MGVSFSAPRCCDDNEGAAAAVRRGGLQVKGCAELKQYCSQGMHALCRVTCAVCEGVGDLAKDVFLVFVFFFDTGVTFVIQGHVG